VRRVSAHKAFSIVLNNRALAGEAADPTAVPAATEWLNGALTVDDAGPFTENFGQAQPSFSTGPHGTPKGQTWPACVCAEDAARFLGWPPYFLSFLARAGHLRPLGKPAQNSRKWYALVELERLSRDPDWLDKAIRIVEKQVCAGNAKKQGKATHDPAPCSS